MSIIIRLQNLPWDATALNVRQFFYGLSIPDGGVHIIGGEKGDVFIAFSTDEDARQAMKNDGGYIGSTQIKLFLSSKAEMQSVISAAREMNSQPQSISSGSALASPMNQFGSPPGYPIMRMPFPNQMPGPPSASSKLRGPHDMKEAVGYPPFSNKSHPMDIRPNFDFRFPSMPGSDFRPPMFDPRASSFEQTRFAVPFDQKPNFPPYNKFPNQASADDGRNGPEQRTDQFWNGSPQSSFSGQASMSRMSSDMFNNQPRFGGFDRDTNDRIPVVMYPTNELFNKVNDKDRNSDKNDYSGFGNIDNYSSRSNQLRNDSKKMDLDGSIRDSAGRSDLKNEMTKILKNIDDRIAASKGQPPSLLATPNFQEPHKNMDGSHNENWRQGSNYRQRSRSPSKRDSKYNDSFRSGRSESNNSNGVYLRISNLPPSFNYRDIRNLFRDFEIAKSGLKIALDKNNRKTGEAFMRVSSVMHMESAMKHDGKMVDGYRIRVDRCHERDFESITNVFGESSRSKNKSRSRSPVRRESIETGGFYAVIKNLPHSSVWKSLEDVRIYKDGGPFIEIKPNGSETGHILVELERKRDLELLTDRCKKMYDGHQALIFAIKRSEFKDRIHGHKLLKKEKAVDKVAEVIPNDLTCMKLNGLSWSSTEDKIKKFFSNCKIVPKGLHILLDDNGKIAGDAYVEFETTTDCSKAMEKNNHYLDNRYLVLSKMLKNEMVAYLNRYVSRNGKILNNTYTAERQTESGLSRISSSNKVDRLPLQPLSVSSDSGPCILFMGNLSFRTQLEDILEFFEGYRIIPDSVQLQYKDDQPTGDGMVQFTSRSEAERALKMLNRKTMLGRTVKLNF